ncbi:PP2C family protein-serine/threonine phosphatase [Actinokineospora sp. HUAS TT18]|uniref:PP2C family protein-serine/threonine phosphatase n=1 Tax=Actinokineospora sp. HUAS TT18 TaxID=3447451 RepID=UPI003F523ED0
MIRKRHLDDRVRVLEAVTDVTLTFMDLDDVLAKLLDQVLDLFQVNTAAVLLLDPESGELVAQAAAGIEEEVWQGVRVPVGMGFAGRVAAAREPVVLDRIDATTVVNPLLWMKKVKVLLGVPMMIGDDVIGVLHVGSFTSRQFSDDDAELLGIVADRLALAVRLQLSNADRAAVAALQRGLLPGRLPQVAGLEFAARYVPGSGTGFGGDWYDVFHLPGGRLGVVIGDVAGSGLGASVVMGRLRSALRAYALECERPEQVLGKLDRKASHFEHDAMATVAYMIVEPSLRRATISVAGHPPPLLVDADGSAGFVPVEPDPPIGFGLAITGRRAHTFDLTGSVVVLYTDGLVERRDEPIEDRMAQLRQAATIDTANAVCSQLMATMVGSKPADDIALLVLRHSEAVQPPE